MQRRMVHARMRRHLAWLLASTRMVPETGPARAQVVDLRFRGAGAAAILERRAPTLRHEHRPRAVQNTFHGRV